MNELSTLLLQANNLLKGNSFEYAFCGGQAIDLFVGRETRKHGDIDVLAYWSERDEIILYIQSLGYEVYEMLGDGKCHHITDICDQRLVKRNIFCCKPECELVHLEQTEEKDILYIEFLDIGQTKLDFIEFLFNDKSNLDFLYARNKKVKRLLSKAILNEEGIPYLAPEICLLYKSTDTERKGYQHDFDVSMAKMDDEQKKWFRDALAVMYPEGHKWS